MDGKVQQKLTIKSLGKSMLIGSLTNRRSKKTQRQLLTEGRRSKVRLLAMWDVRD